MVQFASPVIDETNFNWVKNILMDPSAQKFTPNRPLATWPNSGL